MKITTILAPLALLAFAGCGAKPSATATAPDAVDLPTTTNTVGDPMTMTTPPPSVQKAVPTATMMNARDMKPDLTSYRTRGQIKGIEKSPYDGKMMLTISHENIPDFMVAMEMRLPLAQNADAEKVKVGDKIAFSMNRSSMEVSKIEKLPAATALKLK